MPQLFLTNAVGVGCPNLPHDVLALHKQLMAIGKIPCYRFTGFMDPTIMSGIFAVQRHFMAEPDGVISVNGRTHKFLSQWTKKPIEPDVTWMGRLREAWDLVDPLLPDGSYCNSAYRTADEQRAILHDFFLNDYRARIIAIYGQAEYDRVAADLVRNEREALNMVRACGQAISTPGSSPHQKGKAIDVGGPSNLDQKQVEVIRLVAKAHPELLTGKVLLERNSCVHFEIH